MTDPLNVSPYIQRAAEKAKSPLSRFLAVIDGEAADLTRKKDLPTMDFAGEVVGAFARIIEARDRYEKESGL